jgi:hypothetical protein
LGKNCISFEKRDKTCSTEKVKIGNKIDVILHRLGSSLFDRYGLGSKNAKEKSIEEIEIIKPNIIHLHNVHRYCINNKVFFDYL